MRARAQRVTQFVPRVVIEDDAGHDGAVEGQGVGVFHLQGGQQLVQGLGEHFFKAAWKKELVSLIASCNRSLDE